MKVALAQTAEQRAAAFALRSDVFVAEQGVPADLEVDEFDLTADHFLLYDDSGVPVGAARLVVEPAGFAGTDSARGRIGHLGRLAVCAEARGAGGGAELVGAIESRARELGILEMVLGAQTYAIGFYERLGYTAEGPEFDDAGIPHRWMRKAIVSSR